MLVKNDFPLSPVPKSHRKGFVSIALLNETGILKEMKHNPRLNYIHLFFLVLYY